MEDFTNTISTISAQKIITEFEISKTYFSDILNAQLVIFSLITTIVVGVIIGLYFFFNKKVSKEEIRDQVTEAMNKVKLEIKRDLLKQSETLENKLNKDLTRHEGDIKILRGEIYRTLGQYWKGQSVYSTSFIWWIRAAHSFSQAGDKNMTRISLSEAKESVEKIQNATQLDYKSIGEYQQLITEIDAKTYKIEKELLDKSMKEALSKKN